MHAKNKTEFLKNDYWKASFSLCYCKVSFHFFFPHRQFFKNFSSLVHFFLFRTSFLSLKTFPFLFTFFFFEITLSFLSKRQSVFAFLLSQAQVFLFSLTSDSVKLLIWETEISETWTCVPDVYPLSKLEKKLLSFKHVLLSQA